jgi:hypothetical protein
LIFEAIHYNDHFNYYQFTQQKALDLWGEGDVRCNKLNKERFTPLSLSFF